MNKVEITGRLRSLPDFLYINPERLSLHFVQEL